MKSVRAKIDKRRLTFVRLMGEIYNALNEALTQEHDARGLTRAKMAEILGTDRGTITKLLSGNRNMRLETLADLAYALDRPVKISLPSRSATNQYNKDLGPSPLPSREDKPVNVGSQVEIDPSKPPKFEFSAAA